MRLTRRKRNRKVIGIPFQRGYDPRRHTLTPEERRRGGYATLAKYMQMWRTVDPPPDCPRCGGPSTAELFNLRCLRCGFTWCEWSSCGRQKGSEK